MLARQVVVLSLAWAMLASASVAAPPPKDPFFEALKEAHRQVASSREIVELLAHQSIRAEVGLSEPDYKLVLDYIRESFEATRQLRDEVKDHQLAKEQLVSKILERQLPFDEKIWVVVNDKARMDFERLIGIYIQARGTSAITNSRVAVLIGIDDAQLEQLRDFRNRTWHELMDETREKANELFRENKSWKAGKLYAEAEEKLDKLISEQLSKAQFSRLKELEGEKFDLPKQPFMSRPRRQREDKGENCCNSNAELWYNWMFGSCC